MYRGHRGSGGDVWGLYRTYRGYRRYTEDRRLEGAMEDVQEIYAAIGDGGRGGAIGDV